MRRCHLFAGVCLAHTVNVLARSFCTKSCSTHQMCMTGREPAIQHLLHMLMPMRLQKRQQGAHATSLQGKNLRPRAGLLFYHCRINQLILQ